MNTVIATGALLLLFALGGCIRENLDNCHAGRVLYVRVADINGNDITAEKRVTHADLFIFDRNGNFVRTVSLTGEEIASRTPVTVERNTKVAVWGNIGESEQFSQITTTGSSTVSMRTDPYGYVAPTSDLFFGIKNTAANAGIDEVDIYPKTANLHVTVRGMATGTNQGDYHLMVEQNNNGYDFLGDPTKKTTKMRAGLEFNSTNDLSTPFPINIIHYNPGTNDGVAIELIDKNGNMMAKVDKNGYNEPIAPKAGQTVNILFDFSGSELRIITMVTEWNEIFQWADL